MFVARPGATQSGVNELQEFSLGHGVAGPAIRARAQIYGKNSSQDNQEKPGRAYDRVALCRPPDGFPGKGLPKGAQGWPRRPQRTR